MPSPTDAVCTALSQSLSVHRKSICSDTNEGETIDSSLISSNKLAELTRHDVEYEPADNQQVGTQNVLKTKYIVLDTKITNGVHNGNSSGHSLNGTNQDLSSREFSGSLSSSSPSNIANGLHSNGSLTGFKNGHSNTSSKGSVSTPNSLTNGGKKSICNGNLNGSSNKGNTSVKSVVNPDSVLPKPTHVLFDPDQVVLGWKPDLRGVTGAGMYNLGNTCYLNSTLQALFHIPAFADWLLRDTEHFKKCEQENGSGFGDCVICAMAATLKNSRSNTPYIKPFLIYNKLRMICRHFNHNSQEDAHEFMRHLLESMEKSYLKRFKHMQLDSYSKETTPINQIFGGYIRTEVKCRKCNYASTTFQHFQDLILDIRKASRVEEAMEQYFSNETLEGENSYRCEKCKTMVMAHKKFSIEKPPKVLCIQLKRFNVLGVKMQKTVEHRTHMDLRRFVHPKSEYAKHDLPYRLISMVSHMGQSAGSGHYTAVALCHNQTYYNFDDSMVRSLPLPSVLNHSAYILIYEMEPASPKSVQKAATTSSAAFTSAGDNRNGCGNGLNKSNVPSIRGLPSMKDRDRVSFGLSPTSTSAQPRIIFNTKKTDSQSVIPPLKTSSSLNGVCNGDNGPGLLQAINGKHINGPLKDKDCDPKQSRDTSDSIRDKETCAKSQGPLVPYEYDDDSSSRESSLSPPSTDEKEMTLTVKATTPRDWQVTNSSALSPSIHSESSNISGASATGAHWNVTEDQSALQISSHKKTKENARDLKLFYQSCHLSDTELSNRTAKSSGKSHLRAKSLERGFNLSQDSPYPEKNISDEKHRRRKRSFSSESDASSSSKSGGKYNEVSDLNGLQQNTNFNQDKIGLEKDKIMEHKDGSCSGKIAASSRLQPSEASQGREKSSDNHNISRYRDNSFGTVWNGDNRSDTVSELKKMSYQGFGFDRVSNWNGERSQNCFRGGIRQDSRKRSYDEELDHGRTKKMKNHHSKWQHGQFQSQKQRDFNPNYRPYRPYSNNRHQGYKNGMNKNYGKGFRDRNYMHSNRMQRQGHY